MAKAIFATTWLTLAVDGPDSKGRGWQYKIEVICFTADFGTQAVINIHCGCSLYIHTHPVLIRVIQTVDFLSCHDLPCTCSAKVVRCRLVMWENVFRSRWVLSVSHTFFTIFNNVLIIDFETKLAAICCHCHLPPSPPLNWLLLSLVGISFTSVPYHSHHLGKKTLVAAALSCMALWTTGTPLLSANASFVLASRLAVQLQLDCKLFWKLRSLAASHQLNTFFSTSPQRVEKALQRRAQSPLHIAVY